MVKKSTFKNGLTLVTKNLPGLKSLTAIILVGAGSRYETKNSNGISHFLEHMFFKGAKKYKNAKEVATAIDCVGGEFNAFTGKEYAGYFVKIGSENLETALDVLSDMLTASNFNQSDIDRERQVIEEEYKMYQDTPSYQVGWDFERLIYGDQAMGYDQLGTPEFLGKVSQDDLIAYRQKLYTPDNTVIAIAGNVDHEKAANLCEKLFKFRNLKKAFKAADLKENLNKTKVILRKKYTKQGQIVIGFPAYSESDNRTWALKVLSIILGGNMSSRMFLSVREQKGLAYSITTNTDDYTDSGIISTRAGVDIDRIEDAIRAMIEEYKKLKNDKLSQTELNKAKACLKGKILLKLEDTEEFAHLLSKFELLYKNYKTPEEILKLIDQVDLKTMNAIIDELFIEEKMKMAIIGPFEEKEKEGFEKLLKF
ncbi:hypothetical protein A2335_01050 [Candidatus Peregrinibacteria bacterium RIFOXYB2_FULL_32_7]|nr:MAG: hypothetical protein A2335_01050 [Candidatus Peregrinibacteria bacterium RIFOXYB2_FULL_32_7]